MMRSLARCVALFAVVTCSPCRAQDAKPPAPESRYMRVTESGGGERIALDVSARTFTPVSGKGPVVHLVGAVHIGDQALYDGLQKFLDEQALVLYEGVKPGSTESDLANADDAAKAKTTKVRQRIIAIMAERFRAKNGEYPKSLDELVTAQEGIKGKIAQTATKDAWGHAQVYALVGSPPTAIEVTSLGSDGQPGGEGAAADLLFSAQKPLAKREKQGGDGIQTQLAEALGLKFQLAAMDYSHPSWRNSDLTADQIQQLMGDNNAAAEALFSLLDGSGFAGKMVSVMLGFVKGNPQLAMMVKVMLVETMSHSEEAMMSQARAGGVDLAKLMKVIIHDRNDEVFKDLRRVIAEEPNIGSVAIFYGAGHLPDMEQRLIDMGYTLGSDRWFTAIDLDLSKQPGGVSQAKQMRQMVKRMLEQQRREPEEKAEGTPAEPEAEK